MRRSDIFARASLRFKRHQSMEPTLVQSHCASAIHGRAPGGCGAALQHLPQAGEVVHFITMTSWSSLEAIKGFAGDDAEVAKYYPEDQDFLLEFEPTVVQYEVVGHS